MKSSWKNKLVLFVKGQRECWKLSCFHSLCLASHQQGRGMTLIQSFRCIERASLRRGRSRRLGTEHAQCLPNAVWGRSGVWQISDAARGMLRDDPDNQRLWLKGLKRRGRKRGVREGQRKHLSPWSDWQLTYPWFPSYSQRGEGGSCVGSRHLVRLQLWYILLWKIIPGSRGQDGNRLARISISWMKEETQKTL